MAWSEDLRNRFPGWQSEAFLERWSQIRERLHEGQTVQGTVIARADFGVWVDIDAGHPALLLVPEMQGARERSLDLDDYPAVGDFIEAQIQFLGDRPAIPLTQHPIVESHPPLLASTERDGKSELNPKMI